MASASDIRRQVAQFDREIVQLLARRTSAARKLHAQNEDEDTEWDDQVMANWLEEGFDHGLDEGSLHRVAKDVIDMGKKAAELAS